MRAGPAMAGFDIFEITIRGYGGHAARPHTTVDPVVVQAHIVQALQTIASRSTDPIDSVVVSITQVHGGDRSEEHTSELQSLMRISYAVFCLKKKTSKHNTETHRKHNNLSLSA